MIIMGREEEDKTKHATSLRSATRPEQEIQ